MHKWASGYKQDIWWAVSTTADERQARLLADSRWWTVAAGSQSHRLGPGSASLLSRVCTLTVSHSALHPDRRLNHLHWLLSCLLGSEKLQLLKERLPVIPSFPFGQAPITVDSPLALTSGSCFITKHSLLIFPFIPVWSGAEQKVPPCPHYADAERDNHQAGRKDGFWIRTNASQLNSMLRLIGNQLALATMTEFLFS